MFQINGANPAVTGARVRVGKIRYVILALVTLGIAVNYLDRATMSVALPFIRHEFDLTSALSGIVLSAFFWTYATTQIPAGYFVGRVGPRKAVALSSLLFGAITIFTGFADGVVTFIVMRALLGIGEAPGYPSAAQVVAKWFPRTERAFASGTFNNGNPIGSTLSVPLVALLIAYAGWRSAFFVAGGLALVYSLAWWLIYRSPRELPWVSKREVAYIEDGQSRTDSLAAPVASWGSLFRHRTVWAMMIGFFCINFVAYFFITWFPSYLVSTYHLTLLKFGFLGMIPGFASMLGGWTGGIVADRLVRRGTNLSTARKICLVGGLLGTSIIALAVLSPTVGMALLALSVSYFSSTFAAASVWSLPADVASSERHVGSLSGIQNATANLAGIISPILMGVLKGLTTSFTIPLIIAGCVAIVGAANYAFFMPRIGPLKG